MVLLTDTDVLQPDLLVVSHEREHILTPANIQGSPRPDSRGPVAIFVQQGLAGQTRALRHTRCLGVPDHRPPTGSCQS